MGIGTHSQQGSQHHFSFSVFSGFNDIDNFVVEPCKTRVGFFFLGGPGKSATVDVSLWMVKWGNAISTCHLKGYSSSQPSSSGFSLLNLPQLEVQQFISASAIFRVWCDSKQTWELDQFTSLISSITNHRGESQLISSFYGFWLQEFWRFNCSLGSLTTF